MAAFPAPSTTACNHSVNGRLAIRCAVADVDPSLMVEGAKGTWDGVEYVVTRVITNLGEDNATILAKKFVP
jgi:hypothetical protein